MVDLRQNAEARSILERDDDHLLPVYARYPVVMERGEGVYLFDSSGNRYLDLMAGLRELASEFSRSPRGEARGRGLLLGLDLGRPARGIAEQGLAEGFLINMVQGNVLRFLPPFLLERQHVDSAMELLRKLLIKPATRARTAEAMAVVSAS